MNEKSAPKVVIIFPCNFFCQTIENETLFARDGLTLHMILPRTDLQQATFTAGHERLACRLIKGRKAILSKQNQTIAPVHRFAHHLFLPGSNGSTDEHTTHLTNGDKTTLGASAAADGTSSSPFNGPDNGKRPSSFNAPNNGMRPSTTNVSIYVPLSQ